MKKLFLFLIGLLFHVSLYSAVVETKCNYSEKGKNENVTPSLKKTKSSMRGEIFLKFVGSKWGKKFFKLKEKLIKLRKSIRKKAIFKNKLVGKVGNILTIIFFGIPAFIGIIIGSVMILPSLSGNFESILIGYALAFVSGLWALIGALFLDDNWLSMYGLILFLIPSIAFAILLVLQIIASFKYLDVAYLIILTLLLAGEFIGFYYKILP
jgi:hypothetical protein